MAKSYEQEAELARLKAELQADLAMQRAQLAAQQKAARSGDDDIKQRFQDIAPLARQRFSSDLVSEDVYSPYVSQFVGGLDVAQPLADVSSQFQRSDAAVSQYESLFRSANALAPDTAKVKEELKKFNIDPKLTEDRFAFQKVKGLADRFKQEMSSNLTVLGASNKAYSERMDYKQRLQKAVSDGKVPQETASKLLTIADAKFAQQGGIGTGEGDVFKEFNPLEPAGFVDANDIINKALAGFKKSGVDMAFSGVKATGEYIFKETGSEKEHFVKREDVERFVRTSLENNPMYKSFYKQQAMMDAFAMGDDPKKIKARVLNSLNEERRAIEDRLGLAKDADGNYISTNSTKSFDQSDFSEQMQILESKAKAINGMSDEAILENATGLIYDAYTNEFVTGAANAASFSDVDKASDKGLTADPFALKRAEWDREDKDKVMFRNQSVVGGTINTDYDVRNTIKDYSDKKAALGEINDELADENINPARKQELAEQKLALEGLIKRQENMINRNYEGFKKSPQYAEKTKDLEAFYKLIVGNYAYTDVLHGHPANKDEKVETLKKLSKRERKAFVEMHSAFKDNGISSPDDFVKHILTKGNSGLEEILPKAHDQSWKIFKEVRDILFSGEETPIQFERVSDLADDINGTFNDWMHTGENAVSFSADIIKGSEKSFLKGTEETLTEMVKNNGGNYTTEDGAPLLTTLKQIVKNEDLTDINALYDDMIISVLDKPIGDEIAYYMSINTSGGKYEIPIFPKTGGWEVHDGVGRNLMKENAPDATGRFADQQKSEGYRTGLLMRANATNRAFAKVKTQVFNVGEESSPIFITDNRGKTFKGVVEKTENGYALYNVGNNGEVDKDTPIMTAKSIDDISANIYTGTTGQKK